jgi:hypothetical protein
LDYGPSYRDSKHITLFFPADFAALNSSSPLRMPSKPPSRGLTG